MLQNKRVMFVTRILTGYRAPFHDAVKTLLNDAGIDYELFYGQGRSAEEKKGDLVELPWAKRVPVRYFGSNERLSWQSGLTELRGADLVIIGQENTLLANYPILLWRRLTGKNVALFGHGKNFQATNPNSASERFKQWWSTRVDWWFAYTQDCAQIVRDMGFPADKITVFNNAIDVSSIEEEMAALTPETLTRRRNEIFQGSRNIGVYVGGLYGDKRIPFLLESADRIKQAVPDFQLIIIGGGPDAPLVESAANTRPWLHYVGPKFGNAKTELVAMGDVLLMPGLVGLVVLDAFAYGLPLVTTRNARHSPEFAYLVDGENGVIVEDDAAYADAVINLLGNHDEKNRLAQNAKASLKTYTIANMAAAFCDGIVAALAKGENPRDR